MKYIKLPEGYLTKIKNKDGYFNLSGWFEVLGIDYDKDIAVLIMTAERNMGKTVNVWKFIIEKIWKKYDYKRRVAIIRTNDMKMKESIASFKAAYRQDYEVISGIIYKVERDEKGNVLKDKMFEIGRFVNIENEHNYRSGADGGFRDYHFAFWDEFNETQQGKLDFYQRYMMLFSTIKRHNEPFIFLMIGNKVNASNDIFIKYDLDTRFHDLDKDFVQQIEHDIIYVDIGKKTYSNVNDPNDIVYRMAKYDTATDTLFNKGGFLGGTYYNVVNPNQFRNKEIKYYTALNLIVGEFGTFFNENISNEPLYYIDEKVNADEIRTEYFNLIGLTTEGYGFSGDTNKMDETDLKELANFWFRLLKYKKLFFSSFKLKAFFEEWIYKHTNEFSI